MRFVKKTSSWECERCKYNFTEEYFLNDCTFWFCDECETFLNNQDGFDHNASKHICSNCGYENDTTFDTIKGICSDCGKTLSNQEDTLCEECRRKRIEKARKWLVTAGKVAAEIVVVAGAVILAITAGEEDQQSSGSQLPDNDNDDDNANIKDETKTLYVTNEYSGHGKQNYYWNEYRLEDGEVVKHHCHRQKFFDGDENEWREDDVVMDSWSIDDPEMPEWLKKYL
jgi:hypothetical protein